jgi:hypothetical protein
LKGTYFIELRSFDSQEVIRLILVASGVVSGMAGGEGLAEDGSDTRDLKKK